MLTSKTYKFFKIVITIFLSISLYLVSLFAITLKKYSAFASPITVNISTPYDLNLFATRVNNNSSSGDYRNANVYLLNDIDMSSYSSFQGIGTSSYMFTGTFDGKYKTIKNLKVVGGEDRGLFCYANNATIKNVTLLDGEINAVAGLSAGGIAGSIYGTTSIQNCFNLGCCINIYNKVGNCNVGGIVGYAEGSGKIISCYNDAQVFTDALNESDNYVASGGIVGVTTESYLVECCQNSGRIEGGSRSIKTAYSGGIVGFNRGTVNNCLNKGAVMAHAYTAEDKDASCGIDPFKSNNGDPVLMFTQSSKYHYLRASENDDGDGSYYTKTARYAYVGGIVGYQESGGTTNCINLDETDYYCWELGEGDTRYGGEEVHYYELYYTYNKENKKGTNKEQVEYIRIYGTIVNDLYNSIIGYKAGGSLSNCYHPKTVTKTYKSEIAANLNGMREKGNNDGYNIKSGHYFIEYYVTSSAIKIQYYKTVSAPSDGESKEDITLLYYDNVGASTDEQCISVSINDVVEQTTDIWGLNGGTPIIKQFYWNEFAIMPGQTKCRECREVYSDSLEYCTNCGCKTS